MDTINRIIEQRRHIKMDQAREAKRHQGAASMDLPKQEPLRGVSSKTPAAKEKASFFLTETGAPSTTQQTPAHGQKNLTLIRRPSHVEGSPS